MQKNFDLEFNHRIFRIKREERELTTRKVQEITGITRSTVSNIEAGKHLPDGLNLLKLMFLFDLSKEDVVVRK
jgi:transcriptional regulator with XRE-family HTH domain